MQNVVTRFVWVVALTGVLASVALPSAAAPDPFLNTNGLDVRNGYGSGDVVPLRGVNLGSWLLMEPWMCPMDSSGLEDDGSVRDTLAARFGSATRDSLLATYQDAWLQASDFDRIAELGMNIVRLPFWYLNVEEEDGTWRADAFARMDWAIDQAWQRGIYTLVDLHGAPGGQRADADTTGRKWPTAALWSSSAFQDRTLEIWRRVSEHYRGNPAVAGYDLLNEPMDAPNSAAYWDLLDRCYDVIRSNDTDHIIVMEATYGSWNLDMLPDPATYGWSNVVYQFHVYPWDVWDDIGQLKQVADNTVRDWVNHQGWNVPCHVGEFNLGPEAGWNYAIETYSGSGMGWQMWAFKSTYTGGETSWGVYNPGGTVPPTPNIQTDSAATIAARWAPWSTTNAFVLNPSHRRTLSMPVANDDTYLADPGPLLDVPAPGVLGNDTHMNLGGAGIQLEAQNVVDPSHGAVTLRADGSFTYVAPAGFSGIDTFRYKVWDGRIDSVRNASVSVEVVAGAPGPVAQLRWATQPGMATNGSLLGRQPVLVTADAYGTPSTIGLPDTLSVAITLSGGTGILSGTTAHDLGASGNAGRVQFTDLQVGGAGTNYQLVASVLTLNSPTNLLLNGDFNTPASTADPDHWTLWRFGPEPVWANHELPTRLHPSDPDYWPAGVGVYDGTYQMGFGGNGDNRSAGAYQFVPVEAGRTYTLTVDAGADKWWLPTGEIRIIWVDATGTTELGRATTNTTDSIHDPDLYDVGVPYQAWSLFAVAPPGATQAKIEFVNPVGTGSAWFDNAVLLASVGAPLLPHAASEPFAVVHTPILATTLFPIIDPGAGTIQIRSQGGSVGAQYSLQSTTNLVPPVTWNPVPGSTYEVTEEIESWSYQVTNTTARELHFRSTSDSP